MPHQLYNPRGNYNPYNSLQLRKYLLLCVTCKIKATYLIPSAELHRVRFAISPLVRLRSRSFLPRVACKLQALLGRGRGALRADSGLGEVKPTRGRRVVVDNSLSKS